MNDAASPRNRIARSLLFAVVSVCVTGAANFEAAQSLPQRTENKVFRERVKPNWLPDGHSFWYRVQTGPGRYEFVLIDCKTGKRRSASSPADLGLPALAAVNTSSLPVRIRKTSKTGEPSALTFVNRLDEDVDLYWIDREGRHIRYGGIRAGAEREQSTYEGHIWLITSRSGEHLAVIEGASQPQTVRIDGEGTSTAKAMTPDSATTDSEPGFRSPDGRCTAVVEFDDVPRRRVTIVDSSPHGSVQPRVKSFEYLKPGDPLPKPQWIIRRSDGSQTRVARHSYENPFTESGHLKAVWSPESDEFYFDYNRRGHQLYQVLGVDARTGDVRVVVEEASPTFIDYTNKTWRHWLHETRELIWMSERDGWCHLYLYDVAAGRLKNRITKGAWVVRNVLHVDTKNRQVWFLASGILPDEDPYHVHLCRVGFDGGGFVRLSEGEGNHRIEFSPNREFFVDTWSRADHPPVAELRRCDDGRLICELERADASALLAAGWTMPERFVAKGRDGRTDIHGVLIKPSHFDPKKQYPVVEDIYAGPHSAFAPKEFERHIRLHQIAELGFIVVKLDGMGTNHRGKAFHDVCWKNLKDAGFPDRKLWIAAAARTRPWMDLSRVGIYGGSAGGQNAMRALLDHHDFYHVAVADCGCHDNRMDKIWWNEQWMGWPIDDAYLKSSNKEDAAKLKCRLLLIVGELDTNVDPACTTQVVAALQRADKSFEYMPIVGTGHGAAETPYGSRLRMEFLVKHLHP